MARDLIAARSPGTDVTLRKSRGGVFEITVDGTLRFSKKASGRFPTDGEIVAAVA